MKYHIKVLKNGKLKIQNATLFGNHSENKLRFFLKYLIIIIKGAILNKTNPITAIYLLNKRDAVGIQFIFFQLIHY